jgi:hypothetical protein
LEWREAFNAGDSYNGTIAPFPGFSPCDPAVSVMRKRSSRILLSRRWRQQQHVTDENHSTKTKEKPGLQYPTSTAHSNPDLTEPDT